MFYRAMLKQENARKNGKKAFTLIELIIVIAIIGILVAILVPTMLGFLDNAKESTALANARTAYSAAAAAVTFLQTQSTTGKVAKGDVIITTAELLKQGEITLPAGYEVDWQGTDDNVTGVISVTYEDKAAGIKAKYPKDAVTTTP